MYLIVQVMQRGNLVLMILYSIIYQIIFFYKILVKTRRFVHGIVLNIGAYNRVDVV